MLFLPTKIKLLVGGVMSIGLMGCTPAARYKLPDIPTASNDFFATSSQFMVSTQGPAASRAGQSIFLNKGNIIDAAIAASFTISVERPQSTGIGGGGFLLYYDKKNNKTWVFDFRERAPFKAHANMFLNRQGQVQPDQSITGSLAVGTPGLVKGLWQLHKKFGKLPWKQLLQPAIQLASEGLIVNEHLAMAIQSEKARLYQDVTLKKLFFKNQDINQPLVKGDRLIQKELANSLKIIADKGENGFYQGEIARQIVSSVQQAGGLLSQKDLTSYRVIEREPVVGSYKGFKLVSMPPPSSGGTHVIQILNLLEPQNLNQWGPQHPESLHRTALAMQIAFADRAQYMGDPDFVKVPFQSLISKDYAKKWQPYLSQSIKAPQDMYPGPGLPDGPTETTHLTLSDQEQNMIVSTQTINGFFGAAFVAGRTGILLNNEMDDFSQAPGAANMFGAVGSEKNKVEPLKRPLSSMSPTLVFDQDGQLLMGVGTPSGTRILTCVTQTILNVLEFNMPLYQAVASPRIHQQWKPAVLRFEPGSLTAHQKSALVAKGHTLEEESLGCQIQAVMRTQKQWQGVSDPRGEGLAIGE